MNNWRAPGPSSETADEQPPVTVAERAAEAGTSERTIKRIDRVKREKPELIEKINAGEISIKAAEAIVKAEKPVKAPKKNPAKPVADQADELFESLNVILHRLSAIAETDKAVAKMLREALENYVN
jgi:hypothetical protein